MRSSLIPWHTLFFASFSKNDDCYDDRCDDDDDGDKVGDNDYITGKPCSNTHSRKRDEKTASFDQLIKRLRADIATRYTSCIVLATNLHSTTQHCPTSSSLFLFFTTIPPNTFPSRRVCYFDHLLGFLDWQHLSRAHSGTVQTLVSALTINGIRYHISHFAPLQQL